MTNRESSDPSGEKGTPPREDARGISLRTVIVGILSIVLLVGMLWVADPRRLLDILSEASLGILGLVLLLYFCNVLVKGFRWYLLLNLSDIKAPFRTALSFAVVGLSVSSVTPGRIAGEPVRAYMIREKTGLPFGSGLATVFTERIMDLLVLSIFGVIGLALIVSLLPLAGGLAIAVFILLVVLLFVAVVYLALHLAALERLSHWFVRVASRMARRPSLKWEKAASDTISSFSEGFKSILRSKKSVATTFCLTVIIWLNEAARVFLVMFALSPESVPFVGFVLIASTLATLLGSIVPGGTFNAALIAMVFGASGVSLSLATTAGLLMTFTSIWILVPFGVAILFRNARKVRRAEEEELLPVDVAKSSKSEE
ncbi:MAG: flippase-like domain-containing protein [Thermoplasmata archaeon]|nr:flippase-like domain-containing protein [Thermoplasmata archaeon]